MKAKALVGAFEKALLRNCEIFSKVRCELYQISTTVGVSRLICMRMPLSAGVDVRDVSLVNKIKETPWPGLRVSRLEILSVSNFSFLICSGVIPVLIPMQSADNGAAQMR